MLARLCTVWFARVILAEWRFSTRTKRKCSGGLLQVPLASCLCMACVRIPRMRMRRTINDCYFLPERIKILILAFSYLNACVCGNAAPMLLAPPVANYDVMLCQRPLFCCFSLPALGHIFFPASSNGGKAIIWKISAFIWGGWWPKNIFLPHQKGPHGKPRNRGWWYRIRRLFNFCILMLLRSQVIHMNEAPSNACFEKERYLLAGIIKSS